MIGYAIVFAILSLVMIAGANVSGLPDEPKTQNIRKANFFIKVTIALVFVDAIYQFISGILS